MIPSTKAFRICLIFTGLLLICLILERSDNSVREFAIRKWQGNSNNSTIVPLRRKPENVTVSAFVFYGRKSRVSCLWPYLQANLVENGGWLDEILWIVNTDDKKDLKYLEEITAHNSTLHKKVDFSKDKLGVYTYWKAWQHLDPGKYYVKIDDDIVWIDDNAIPELVTAKIENPHAYLVSGNVINNPPLGFLHLHMGAIRPFLPETERPIRVPRSWKPSAHGPWRGDANKDDDYKWPLDSEPPYDGHRWLRVQDDRMISQTPIYETSYEVWGTSYTNWAITAQQHYSLLDALEHDDLQRYKFAKPWHMHGERIRINFLCIHADDVLSQNMTDAGGDEDNIAINFPKKLRRPVLVIGGSLAAHFQYQGQDGLEKTDLLSRYQMLADEKSAVNITEISLEPADLVGSS
ncbi:hypothetical protein MN608_11126 [Microdochium nivale]|nr:hypothetical protein MN608_11126 [Microdochium nivale]